MTTGKAQRFDHSRGHGFITADDSGDEVFLHASMFDGDTNGLVPIVRLEFQFITGDRGRKAFDVRLSGGECTSDGPASSARVSPALRAVEYERTCEALSEEKFKAEITELIRRSPNV